MIIVTVKLLTRRFVMHWVPPLHSLTIDQNLNTVNSIDPKFQTATFDPIVGKTPYETKLICNPLTLGLSWKRSVCAPWPTDPQFQLWRQSIIAFIHTQFWHNLSTLQLPPFNSLGSLKFPFCWITSPCREIKHWTEKQSNDMKVQ